MGRRQPQRCRGPPFPTPLGRPAPHLSRPLPLGPGRAGRRRLGGAGEPVSLRGAPMVGEPGTPSAPRPFQASNTRSGRASAEQYSPAWLLLRDHPSTCPLPLLGPALRPLPRAPLPQLPVPRADFGHGDPPSCCPRRWAPASAQPAEIKGPDPGGRGARRVPVGETRTPGDSLSRQLRASVGQVGSHQAPSSEDARHPGGAPLVGTSHRIIAHGC